MFDFSFLYKYLGFDSPKLIFLTYLFIEICVITTIYYFQYRFCKINFESNFLKFCQLVINSIYLPMMLFITVNVICDRNNFFLQYVDDYFINIINNFKRISFVWMCWLGFAKFITNVEKTMISKREETNKTFVEVVVKILKFIAFFILGMMILNLFGFSFVEFLKKSGGSVGLITTGIMLVWKSQLTNITSGFFLFLNKNFKVGNRISLPEKNINGKILELGLNKVKILLDNQKVVNYPNTFLSGATYINLPECKNTISNVKIFLQYIDYDKIGTVTDEIKTMLLEYKEINKNLLMNVYCNEILQNSALIINIDFFFNITDTSKIKRLKQEILMKSIGICLKNNCHIFEEYD